MGTSFSDINYASLKDIKKGREEIFHKAFTRILTWIVPFYFLRSIQACKYTSLT